MRTGTEGKKSSTCTSCIPPKHIPLLQALSYTIQPYLQAHQRGEQTNDTSKELCSEYELQKVASTACTKTVIDFQTYNLYANQSSPECSNVIYYQVLSQQCDDKETSLNITNNIYQECVVTKKTKCKDTLGRRSNHILTPSKPIKTEYGNDLSWMIPFPGD